MHFDFKRLSSVDLEDLARDIFEKVLKVKLESFSAGPDHGIDVRYSSPDKENEIVIQCKHSSNWNNLISNLKKEVEKVKLLNPERYIVVTTLELTPDRKKKIKTLFASYIKNTADIWGKKDLTKILSDEKYADILKKHLKLWLDSSVILQHVLEGSLSKTLIRLPKIIAKIVHSAEYNRAVTQKQKIEEYLKVFVQNNSFNEALDLLKRNNYCVISGAPGIGKTTLANMLSYYFIKHNYELVHISKDIDEANKLFKSDKKQFFYYDDFLGRNFLEDGLDKNEDQRIIDFIRKISRSKNKKLVFTTREYILNQAVTKYSKFDKECGAQGEKLCFSKYIINLEDYTKYQRARIIYNHWYHSDMPRNIKDDILQKNLYYNLIEHKNFNPRVIQQISKKESFQQCNNGVEYIESAKKMLNNPNALWEDAFTHHISESSRDLLYCLISLSSSTNINLLKEAWIKLKEHKKNKYGGRWESGDFEKSLKELEGAFIRINRIDFLIVNYIDPSVQDFLINKIKKDISLIEDLLKSSIVWKQTEYFFYATTSFNKTDTEKDLWNNDKILALIKENFDKKHLKENISIEKKLYWMWLHDLKLKEFINEKIEQIKNNPQNKEYFLALLIELKYLEDFDHESFIYEYIDCVTEDRLKNLIEIISIYDLKNYLLKNDIPFSVFSDKADEFTEELIDLSDYSNDEDELNIALESAEIIENFFDISKSASECISRKIDSLEENRIREDENVYDYAYDEAMNYMSRMDEKKNIENLFNAGL